VAIKWLEKISGSGRVHHIRINVLALDCKI